MVTASDHLPSNDSYDSNRNENCLDKAFGESMMMILYHGLWILPRPSIHHTDNSTPTPTTTIIHQNSEFVELGIIEEYF